MILEVEEELKKVCSQCNAEKTLEFFNKNKKGKLGRKAECKECSKKVAKIKNIKSYEKLKIRGIEEYPQDIKKICTYCKVEKELKDFSSKLGGKFDTHARCKECLRAIALKKLEVCPELREQKKIYAREYRKRIPEYSQNRNKKRVKNSRLLADYNIDLEGYKEMQIIQNDCCAICKRARSEFKKQLSVDHDHNNGKIRALLCSNCNMGLGLFGDNSELLIKAAKYIDFYKEIHNRN